MVVPSAVIETWHMLVGYLDLCVAPLYFTQKQLDSVAFLHNSSSFQRHRLELASKTMTELISGFYWIPRISTLEPLTLCVIVHELLASELQAVISQSTITPKLHL